MSTTLQDLRDIAYSILREEQNSLAYPYTLMDLMLNSAQQRICNGTVINPLSKEEVRKGQLPFLNSNQFYSNVQQTSLSADTTVGATTLSVASTTGYTTTGYLFIQGDIITYTGTTATSFTGVSGVSFAFTTGTQVSIAFALPADYGSMINITYNNKFKLENKLYDDIFEDLNNYKGTDYNRNRSREAYGSPYRLNPFYSIIDGAYLVIFNLNQTGDTIFMRYESIPTEMTLSTSTVKIDNDIYAKTTIPYIAVGEMMYNRGEESRGGEILNFGLGQVREMYNYYNNKSFEKISGTTYKLSKGKLNI